MKAVGILFVALFLWSCSDKDLEEFAFRKTLEYKLVDLCGEEDKECIAAVEAQIKSCMVKSNWRDFLNNEDNEVELKRFTQKFYLCIVDQNGHPYFEPKV